jgi:hypothetical protein
VIEARLVGDVCKCTVPVVVIERIPMDSGDEQVGIAIVIVVAHGDAVVVSSAGQVGLFGYIGKDTVAVVAKEPILVLRRVFA